MPTTANSHETSTPLPRAVRERSERIRQRIESQQEVESNPQPPAVIAPPEPSPVEPQPKAQTPADRDNDPAYWKHRWSVTNGFVKRIEERHEAEVTSLNQQIAALRQEVLTLKSAQPAPSGQAVDLGSFFTPEQIEQLGEDHCRAVVDATMKVAKSQLQGTIDAQLQPLLQDRERNAQRQQQSAQDRFEAQLAEAVPEYAALDDDPDWLAWLAEEDPGTGLERQHILERHVKRLDAGNTVKLMMAYLATKAAPPQAAPAPQPPVAPSGTANPAAGRLPQRSAIDVTPPTAAEIRDYHKRKATKRPGMPGYVTEEEAQRFEARLKLRFQRPAE